MQPLSWLSPVKIVDLTMRAALARAAKQYAKGKLVDLGCGTKPYREIFSPHIDSYYGVDFQPTAAANYGAATAADLYCDCTDTRLPAASFDTLLSTQVMEHIADTAKYLAECRRLLRPGGAAIFTVPLVWPCHAEPCDYYRFTRCGLRYLFEREGFKVEEISGMGFAFATMAQTAINALFSDPKPAFAWKLLRRAALLTAVPLLNAAAAVMEGFQKESPLSLSYLVAARKI